MSSPDIEAALTPVVDALDRLDVRYQIGGSVATSSYGVPRATLDVDLVIDIQADQVNAFVDALSSEYYVDAEMIQAAIRRQSSFNVIHLATMIKIDGFILRKRPFSREAFARGIVDTLDAEATGRTFVLASPEDMVVHKLEWFRLGGEVSDRQWTDVLGVLRVQGEGLDQAYMRKWAAELSILDLLEKALSET